MNGRNTLPTQVNTLLQDFWSPNINMEMFSLMTQISLEGHKKKIYRHQSICETWMEFVRQILIRLKTSCVQVSSVIPLMFPGDWLMQTYCDHSVTTQACTLVEWNHVLLGSASSSRELTLWQTVELPVIWDVVTFTWCHSNEIGVMSLYHTDDLLSHPYEITFEIQMT